jgi:membrane protease YdiL (CAAX protease family)
VVRGSADGRRGHTAVELAYQALVRIPLGAAVLEEFAFRGVLLGLFVRTGPTKTAVAVSFLLFGLWHIRPTVGTLATNDLAEGAWAQTGAVTAAVALTTVGGLLFCALRLASGSLVAPLIVHTATNSVLRSSPLMSCCTARPATRVGGGTGGRPGSTATQ